MKRVNPLRNKIVQYGYEHPGFDKKIAHIRKSADEFNKMLNKMSKKEEKKEK